MSCFERDYGTATTVVIPLVLQSDTNTFATSSDWTPAAGDVKVVKDGGAAANIGTLPTNISGTGLWSFTISAAEVTAKETVVQIIDATGAVVVEDAFTINTTGNASAMHVAERDIALVTQGDLEKSVGLLLSTTVATVNSSTSIVLTAGSAFDSAYPDCLVIVGDISDSEHATVVKTATYTASSKTLTTTTAPVTGFAVGDKIYIHIPSTETDVSTLATLSAQTAMQTSINNLNNLAAADVNAQVVDVLKTDAMVANATDPGNTPTFQQCLHYLYQHTRNTQTIDSSGNLSVKDDDGTTDLYSATFSDTGTLATRTEWA